MLSSNVDKKKRNGIKTAIKKLKKRKKRTMKTNEKE